MYKGSTSEQFSKMILIFLIFSMNTDKEKVNGFKLKLEKLEVSCLKREVKILYYIVGCQAYKHSILPAKRVIVRNSHGSPT